MGMEAGKKLTRRKFLIFGTAAGILSFIPSLIARGLSGAQLYEGTSNLDFNVPVAPQTIGRAKNSSGNGHGFRTFIEYDTATKDILDVVVENNSSHDAYVEVGGIGSTIRSGMSDRISLRNLNGKTEFRDNNNVVPLDVITRWPA